MGVRLPRTRRPASRPRARAQHRARARASAWNRHRDTLDNLLEGFQVIARDWTYLYVNPAAARHGRSTPDALINRRMIDLYPGIERSDAFRAMSRCMHDRQPAAFETHFTFADGQSRWFELRVEPVPEGICVHSVDIQDQKLAEDALREQESVARLGEMAAVVAHEIKNPLAGVSGALQVLRRRRGAGDPEIAIVDEMLASIQSLDRLVRDLLIFARPVRVDTGIVSVPDVVHDALLVLQGDAVLQRHDVMVSVDAMPPPLRGDQDLLKNVFRNLFLNAAEAMRDAGAIRVRIGVADGQCRVSVADTGPGIPAGQAVRIFEPFVTAKPGGTGLGLPISRRIVRLHGGDLQLMPSDRGAVFVVTLPFHEGHEGLR